MNGYEENDDIKNNDSNIVNNNNNSINNNTISPSSSTYISHSQSKHSIYHLRHQPNPQSSIETTTTSLRNSHVSTDSKDVES